MPKDVAIIGASTAGLLTAKKLADHGMDVKVFEASKQIDPTPRSLIVTGHLPKLLGPLYQNSLVNVIRRFELYERTGSAGKRQRCRNLYQPSLFELET
jgi:flavin-dependent dehydrogenase